MWSVCRFPLLAAVLYASYSYSMQSAKPHTDLHPAGPSASSLRNTPNTARGNVLICTIFGTDVCDSDRCQEAGGRCTPSLSTGKRSSGKQCSQKVLYDTGEVEPRLWRLHDPTRSACRNCACRGLNYNHSTVPSSPPIRSPAGHHVLTCKIRGTGSCDINRCEEAGGRCLPSFKAKLCSQRIQFETGELIGKRWRSFDQTMTACQGCECRSGKPSFQESIEGLSMLGSPSLQKCIMLSKAGMNCNTHECWGADGRCVLESSGHCLLGSPEYGAAACSGCWCRRKGLYTSKNASGG
jgi:hypothetical protein